MKRLNFPLERVRRWRSEQAILEELKLQQLRSEMDQLGAAKLQVQEAAAEAARRMFAQPSVEAIELQTLDSYRIFTRGQIQGFEERERECEERIAQQFKKVIEARRQFELLDQLHAKALAKWHTASDKEQEDLAGELYLAKMTRNARRR